ncbi:hypothetical protein, partial [Escherichia coli]|uniref:hypothetical protein n=1 Tax=Escherichia coli TaxID=562 RepID=UPI00207BB04D
TGYNKGWPVTLPFQLTEIIIMNTETLCEISAHHFPTIIVKRSKLLIAAFFFRPLKMLFQS